VHNPYITVVNRVETYASNWCSWLVTVPLLTYICLSTDFGKIPNKVDATAVIMNFLTIVFGLAMQFRNVGFGATVFFFVMSSLCYCVGAFCMYLSNIAESSAVAPGRQRYADDVKRKITTPAIIIKRKMSITLCLIMPLFAIVYVLAIMKVLDKNSTLACYLTLDVLAKGLVAFAAMDSHMAILFGVRAELESELAFNKRRRDFMKYMFHETRIPLNAFSMGLDALDNIEHLAPLHMDVLKTMNNACEYLEHSLDSYLIMVQIEEGSFDVFPKPFRTMLLFEELEFKIRTKFKKTGACIDINMASEPSMKVMGDMACLSFALQSIVSFALGRWTEMHPMIITVTSHSITDDIDVMHISLEDNGFPMNEFELEALLKPYSTLFTGDMLDKDSSGLSLAISREIFSLHNGTLDITNSNFGLKYDITLNLPIANSSRMSDKTSGRESNKFSIFDVIRQHGGKKLNYENSKKSSEASTADKNECPVGRFDDHTKYNEETRDAFAGPMNTYEGQYLKNIVGIGMTCFSSISICFALLTITIVIIFIIIFGTFIKGVEALAGSGPLNVLSKESKETPADTAPPLPHRNAHLRALVVDGKIANRTPKMLNVFPVIQTLLPT
jgi:signal transduction histidine kinase